MRTATTLMAILALLVIAVGCSAPDTAPEQPATADGATADPVVDAYDDGLEDTATEDDAQDLESLDEDLAAFE